MSSLTFDPLIPRALWVTLAVLSAGLLVTYALASRSRIPRRRRGAILALMALAVGLPLVILLNPTWIEPVPPPEGKPLLTILVDASASMAIRDADEGESRYLAAVQTAEEMTRQLSEQFDVRVQSVGAATALTDLDTLRSLQSPRRRHESDRCAVW